MSHRARTLVALVAVLAVAACSDTSPPSGSITGPAAAPRASMGSGLATSFAHARVCPGALIGQAHCHAIVRVDASGNPAATTTPSGYVPSDLQAAYGLSSSGGSGQTIAIVDAFDDANAESDLAVYRSQFGLPPCTTANGCFRKVDQNGGTNYPRGDQGWAEEISLDLDMASAICSNCKILLVEASSNSFTNLAAAEDEAAALGANVISNSYGGGEYSGEVGDQSHFDHPGIAITVSTGDSGYGVEFPASSQYVTAVGGTTLTRSSGGGGGGNGGGHGHKPFVSSNTATGWTETAWSGSGSGCSAYISKPSWQTDTAGCANRTVADVAAVADPNTGVAVYDTYRLGGRGGWLVFGGTSVSAPIIAGVYALAGNESSIGAGASYSYAHTNGLTDITSGSNGSCGGSYLCTAGTGYDGPTGLGTPNGTNAF